MKKLSTRILTIYCIALVIGSALLIAASPYQTGEPPAPVSFVDQIVIAVITALTAGIGWLLAEVRKLKTQAAQELEKRTPEEWHWLWAKLAATFVKAAYQGIETSDGAAKLAYVENLMYEQFERYGFVVDAARKREIRAIIEAAYFDFKEELMVIDLEDPDHK